MSAVETRVEKTVNNRNRGVTSYTLELVGANSVNDITPPSGAKNIRRSIADGRAVLTYEQQDEGVGDTYSVSGTASQEPLATHPYFQSGGKWEVSVSEWKTWDKWQKEGADIAQENIASYSTGFQKFVELTLKGFTDYLQPRVTIRVTDANTDEPSISDLGKIDSPTRAPQLSSGANWLLAGIDATQDADGKWEVTREFISSGPGGWNEDIYGAG